MSKSIPATALKAALYFSRPQTSEALLRKLRWPGGIVCPWCASKTIGFIATRNLMRCKECHKQFSFKTGTFFENSRLELGQWFLAVFVLTYYPKLTCQQWADLIGVTLRTAWAMRTRLIWGMSHIHKSGNFKNRLSQLLLLSPKK